MTVDSARIRVLIEGVDKTRVVDYTSLRITQVITSEPDSCEFVIKKFGARTYIPVVGDEVVITQDGTTMFGGIITEVIENYAMLDYVGYRVICSDYTYLLDNKLVIQTYEDMTIVEILQSIKEEYLPNDVSINNVDVTTVVNYAAFKYEPVSSVLTQLAELVGADWYIDYDKDIHFNEQLSIAAPFNLSDTGNKYIYDSLIVRRDQTQVRNVVYVRGGDYLANTTTAVFEGNGTERYFYLPYKMSELGITVTGQEKSVGVDPIDDPNEFDAMHNFQEKVIFFRTDRTPRDTSALAASQKVRIHGRPNLPILVQERDSPSIMTFTAREHFINDPSIQTKRAARERALAELDVYKSTIAEGEFQTYEMDLHTGEKITLQSTLRDLDEEYIINRLEWSVLGTGTDGNTRMICKVSLVTTRSFGFTQLLQRLLNKDKKHIILDGTETLERIHTFDDTFSGVDSSLYSASPSVNYRWGPASRNSFWNFGTWS